MCEPQYQPDRRAHVRKKEIWLQGTGKLPQPEEETNHRRKLRFGIPIILPILASLLLIANSLGTEDMLFRTTQHVK
jgi:hypothetical protein